MKRMAATFACDLRLQYRNGFYYAALVTTVAAVLLLHYLPTGAQTEGLSRLLPAVIANNLLVNTFFFVGGLVLLEKTDGTLQAQAVTPLRAGEYLGAKTATLLFLSLLENLILARLVTRGDVSSLLLVAAITIAAGFYTLAGFALVVRYDSMNEYLLPALLYAAVLALPLLPYFGIGNLQWVRALAYLHPLQPVLLLLEAAFRRPAPVLLSPIGTVYVLVAGSLWTLVAAYAAVKAYDRYVVEGV